MSLKYCMFRVLHPELQSIILFMWLIIHCIEKLMPLKLFKSLSRNVLSTLLRLWHWGDIQYTHLWSWRIKVQNCWFIPSERTFIIEGNFCSDWVLYDQAWTDQYLSKSDENKAKNRQNFKICATESSAVEENKFRQSKKSDFIISSHYNRNIQEHIKWLLLSNKVSLKTWV